jgi:hypothetical protein
MVPAGSGGSHRGDLFEISAWGSSEKAALGSGILSICAVEEGRGEGFRKEVGASQETYCISVSTKC